MFDDAGLALAVPVFLAAAAVLILVGSRFATLVDTLADKTGIGEAVAGAVLLGATTSLPGGLITSVVAAWDGQASFAVSNAVGGIAAQTVFLAIADLLYRRANLEHAAASLPNVLQAIVLIGLVSAVTFARYSPEVTLLGVHPVTIALLGIYAYGLRLVSETRDRPAWQPQQTPETVEDEPAEDVDPRPLSRLWGQFALMALIVAVSGFVIARSGLAIAEQTPLSGTVVGGLFTSVASSLPELVTVIAATRAGALTLAVGDIIGGNVFDVLFVGAADIAYREGSIYHALGRSDMFLLSLTLLLTSVLVAGLVHREEKGIGFEGIAMLVLYAGGFIILFTTG